MITKIYNTKINQTQTLKDFLVEHNFTGEYLIAFEYIVSTVPEELLRDKNGSLSKPFIALLVILSYFVGSSREDILKLAYAKDISALYDITFRNLKKEYDKYYDADPIEALSFNDFILSKENFHDYPEAYLLCLLAIEHGYRPKDIRDSIDEYIKELLQNRGVVEMLELSKAYRGSLTAIKEVLINEMVTKNLNAPDNLKIDEPEPHKIDITNFEIPSGLIEKDSLLYRHLMRIKPAGTKIVFPEVIKNIFDNLVKGVYGATLFSGIGDTNSQGIILKENIIPRPTPNEVRTAPTVRIEQASAYAVHAVDIIITQTNPEPSIVEYRLTVTFPNGGYKVFAERQVVVPAATLYSTNEATVRFINEYKVPIELKVETIAIKRTSEPFRKLDLSGVYTTTIVENPHGITILNPEQPALDWEEIEEDLSFIEEFEFFEEFTGTHLQGCGFGFSELNNLPATDYSIGDVIRGRLNKIGGSTCPTWAYFKVVAKYTPPVKENYVRFVSAEARTITPKYTNSGVTLEYSVDSGKTWTTISSGSATTSATEHWFRGQATGTKSLFTTSFYTNAWAFSGSSDLEVYGNLNFLLCDTLGDEEAPTSLGTYAYAYMFRGCTSLTTAPELPATTLANNCYHYMFSGCTSLTTAPELPATTLARSCYNSMFSSCTSLTTAPELPATTLADSCYYWMFYNCTSLTTAPELPATTLADYCYNSMFYGCTSFKVSETNTGSYIYAWRIHTSGTGNTASYWNDYMLTDTGGTFTSNPSINTTYYVENQPV